MPYQDDPGGVFASDTHRRVMANVPNPDDDPLSTETLLAERIVRDDHLEIEPDHLDSVLSDLEADGHIKQLKNGWRNTVDGWEALTNEKANERAAKEAGL